MTEPTSEPTVFTGRYQLYRLYDGTGDLIYIGRTCSIGARFDQHAKKQPWWHEVVDCRIELFPDYETLVKAERIAIKQEAPRYNVVHNKGWPWLYLSERVTAAAAEFLHKTCRNPGDGPHETSPCRKCFRKAAWMLSYSDAAIEKIDPEVAAAQSVSYGWNKRASDIFASIPLNHEKDLARFMLQMGWHHYAVVQFILTLREESKKQNLVNNEQD